MSYGSRKRGYNQGGCVRGGWPSSPAYNVEPISHKHFFILLCERRTPPWLLASTLAAVRTALFFALRDSYGWQHLSAAKPHIRPESRLARSAVVISFWNCVSNVVQISHIIAENDPHLFCSLLSVGNRAVRKFRLKLKKNHGIFKNLAVSNRLCVSSNCLHQVTTW